MGLGINSQSWQTEDVINIQASALVWDYPVQQLYSSSCHWHYKTSHAEYWITGLGQEYLLGQKRIDRERWRIPARDKETKETLL